MEDFIPNFTLETNPPTEDENRLFGIFISHSSADNKYLNELAKKMQNNGLNPIYDREFLKGGDYFHDKIRKCINCYAGVVIITKKSLKSDWVNYECGYFSGLSMPIVLWDPENVLSLRAVDNDLLNVHLSQYLPALNTSDEVVDHLKKLSVYSEIFKNECRDFSKADFRAVLEEKVETVMVKISSDFLNSKKELFDECKLGTLVVNFGMFYKNQSDGIHCWAKRSLNVDGSYSVDTAPCLCDHKCEITNAGCAMFSSDEIQTDKKECVILNHIIYNGRYFDRGDKYYNGDELDEGLLSFYVPVHKVYGTEFKFIVDAPSNSKFHELLTLFEEIGLDPSTSDSLNGLRIYLSIPETPAQAFFKLDHLFSNNFLCPMATLPLNKRQ